MARADNKQPLTKLGDYEIIRPLARGGMAELFLVRVSGPEGFEKVLVLKKILPHFAENPRFVRSFLDEAKLVAGFDHPHIAHVHNMGNADGSYFFTMEFVHGVDVRTILRRYKRDGAPLPFGLAVLIVRNVASALHYAHERRGVDGKSLHVVHRDVSPSNIIVSYDGVPKLVDFGIAKASSSSMRTQTGALKGKIAYMSPEQAKGAPIDRRTDVYALGIVLWELIANRRLYKSENDLATIQKIISEPAPSLREHQPECPPALERIVERALSRDIDARYQTAEQLQLDLEDFAVEHKLKQSAVALSAELKRTFALDLRVWNDAHAGAVTVTDAIASPLDDRTKRLLLAGADALYDDDSEDRSEDALDDHREEVPTAPLPLVRNHPVEEPGDPVEPPRSSSTSTGAAALATDVPARRNRTWIWLGGIGVSATIGIGLAIATSGGSSPPAAPRAVPAAVSGPSPVRAADAAAPLPATAAVPEPAPEIEMTPVEVSNDPRPEPKRVKRVAPKPTPKAKPTPPKPPPKPKPAFDPNAVFPPAP